MLPGQVLMTYTAASKDTGYDTQPLNSSKLHCRTIIPAHPLFTILKLPRPKHVCHPGQIREIHRDRRASQSRIRVIQYCTAWPKGNLSGLANMRLDTPSLPGSTRSVTVGRRKTLPSQILCQSRLPTSLDVLHDLCRLREHCNVGLVGPGRHGVGGNHGLEPLNRAVKDDEKIRRVAKELLIPCWIFCSGQPIESHLCLGQLDEDAKR